MAEDALTVALAGQRPEFDWRLDGRGVSDRGPRLESLRAPHLPVPGLAVDGGSGDYAGLNSLNLQEIYLVEKQPAVRSQIARGRGKPIIVRLPGGDLLASQYKDLESQRNPAYPQHVSEMALCRSTDEGLSWSEPRCWGWQAAWPSSRGRRTARWSWPASRRPETRAPSSCPTGA